MLSSALKGRLASDLAFKEATKTRLPIYRYRIRDEDDVHRAGDALTVAQALLPKDVPSRMQMPAYGGTNKISRIEHLFMRSDVERVVTIDPASGKALFVSSAADFPSPNACFRQTRLCKLAPFCVMSRRLDGSGWDTGRLQEVTGFTCGGNGLRPKLAIS